jgi:hypothetical protein
MEVSGECARSGLGDLERGDGGLEKEGDLDRPFWGAVEEDLLPSETGAGEEDLGLGVGLGVGRDLDGPPKGHHQSEEGW